MKQTLFALTDWQWNFPSIADRYSIEKGIDFDSLVNNETINTDFFMEIISLFQSDEELPVEQLKSFSVEVILDYLEKTHHYYLNKKLLEIEQSILNLQQYMPENKLLSYLGHFFEWIKENLHFHIKMEEEQLFPYIKSLYSHKDKKSTFSIQSFIHNHSDNVEMQLSEVKKHIVRALPSATEIFPFRVLLKQLDDFEKDLRIHAKIEDEVLIPLALEMDK